MIIVNDILSKKVLQIFLTAGLVVSLSTTASAQSFLKNLKKDILGDTANASQTDNASFTQSSCSNQQNKSRNKMLGGVFGSAGGNAIAKEIGGENKGIAMAIGVTAGGIIGSELGEKLTPCDKELVQLSTVKALETGQGQTWENSETGNGGKISVSASPISVPGHEGEICRTREMEYKYSEGLGADRTKTMCKGPDGVWSVV